MKSEFILDLYLGKLREIARRDDREEVAAEYAALEARLTQGNVAEEPRGDAWLIDDYLAVLREGKATDIAFDGHIAILERMAVDSAFLAVEEQELFIDLYLRVTDPVCRHLIVALILSRSPKDVLVSKRAPARSRGLKQLVARIAEEKSEGEALLAGLVESLLDFWPIEQLRDRVEESLESLVMSARRLGLDPVWYEIAILGQAERFESDHGWRLEALLRGPERMA